MISSLVVRIHGSSLYSHEHVTIRYLILTDSVSETHALVNHCSHH